MNVKIICVVVSIMFIFSCINVQAEISQWPPRSSYENMNAAQLDKTILYMIKEAEVYEKQDTAEATLIAFKARFNIALLIRHYAQKTDQPVDTVDAMYGNPTKTSLK